MPEVARHDADAQAARKAELRRRLRAARAAMTADERSQAARGIRDAVLSLPEAEMAGTIAAYFSVGTEPGTRSLVYALWKRGSYVLLPLFLPDGNLDWASYEGPDSVRYRLDGRFGLAEPTEPPRGVDTISRADLVIVPALAVDKRGIRLGRGAGCYDRALARVGAAVPTVAVVYDTELLDDLPAEPHDRPVRLVARPTAGVTRLTG
ncbi:MAG: 5-formyltetrahydrofolate cyclo-ligase [Micromonosporaceae bacterium]